jgi:hypothetical protein
MMLWKNARKNVLCVVLKNRFAACFRPKKKNGAFCSKISKKNGAFYPEILKKNGASYTKIRLGLETTSFFVFDHFYAFGASDRSSSVVLSSVRQSEPDGFVDVDFEKTVESDKEFD